MTQSTVLAERPREAYQALKWRGVPVLLPPVSILHPLPEDALVLYPLTFLHCLWTPVLSGGGI